MIQELHPTSGHQMIPNGNRGDADDLTPVHTPTNSPSTTRKRIVSVSNPEPMIKLMVQGVLQKVESFLDYLEDKLLLSVVEECDGILKTTAQGGCGHGRGYSTVCLLTSNSLFRVLAITGLIAVIFSQTKINLTRLLDTTNVNIAAIQ